MKLRLLLGVCLLGLLTIAAYAATIGVNIGVSLSGSSPISRANAYSGTQAGSSGAVLTQTIATNPTTLTLGNLAANPGGLLVRNLDGTNFLQIDANTNFNGFPQKLLPGQAVFLLPQTTNLFAKASTNAVRVEITTYDP